MKLKLVNRSDWPTPALKVLARWIVGRAGIKCNYSITIADTQQKIWAGRGGRLGQHIRFNRRLIAPFIAQDHRVGVHFPPRVYRSRVELLVFLLAHEAYHATDGHPDRYRETGRTDRAGMEYDCNKFAADVAQEFRLEWPIHLREKVYAAAREARDRNKRAVLARIDPSPKLTHAQQLLAQWDRRAKLCRTKIAKYRRKIAYYQGRVAAKPRMKPDRPMQET